MAEATTTCRLDFGRGIGRRDPNPGNLTGFPPPFFYL